MPSHKVLIESTVVVIGALVIVVQQLADQGIELPGWVALAVAVLAPIAGWAKSEGNPSPSARAAVAAEQGIVWTENTVES